jgi:hypothetical protein
MCHGRLARKRVLQPSQRRARSPRRGRSSSVIAASSTRVHTTLSASCVRHRSMSTQLSVRRASVARGVNGQNAVRVSPCLQPHARDCGGRPPQVPGISERPSFSNGSRACVCAPLPRPGDPVRRFRGASGTEGAVNALHVKGVRRCGPGRHNPCATRTLHGHGANSGVTPRRYGGPTDIQSVVRAEGYHLGSAIARRARPSAPVASPS